MVVLEIPRSVLVELFHYVAAVIRLRPPEFLAEVEFHVRLRPELLGVVDDADGSTLLHVAAVAENAPVARLLARRRPDLLGARDARGLRPLDLAADCTMFLGR